jgi:hypothetical protein
VKNTNIVLLSFLAAVLTISFIQYSDAASADDRNVRQFCDRTAPFYYADKDAYMKKYENHSFVKFCDFYDSSKYPKSSSNDNAEAKVTKYPKSSSNDNAEAKVTKYPKSSSNEIVTNYWADKFGVESSVNLSLLKNEIEGNRDGGGYEWEKSVKFTENDIVKYVPIKSNLWSPNHDQWEKSVKFTENDIVKYVPKSIITNPTESEKINLRNDYKPFNNDYKPNNRNLYDNQLDNRYSPHHPVNNPYNSIRHQPTYDWGMFTNPFFR